MIKYPLLISYVCLAIFLVSCSTHPKGDNADATGTDSLLTVLNNNIEEHPGDPSYLVKRAEYYLQAEKLGDAIKDINKALELDPRNQAANITLSSIDILTGKPQQALDILNKVIADDPSCVQAHLKLAKLYLVMKDYEHCAGSVEKVFELDPHNADAYYLKGVVLDENKETAKAIEAFQKAVLYNPQHFDALMQLGYANISSNPKMAIDYFNNAVKAIPGNPEAMYNVGMLYQENGQPEKALETYAEMLKQNPKDKLALYNSGYINLVYLSKYSLGSEFFTKAIEADSVYTDAYYNRGYCKELLGDIIGSRSDYNKVLQLRVNDKKAIDGLNRLDKMR